MTDYEREWAESRERRRISEAIIRGIPLSFEDALTALRCADAVLAKVERVEVEEEKVCPF